jgi:YVTN family beta-propeller protein
MRNWIFSLFVASLCCLPASASACREVIVSNEASGDLAVIDPRANQVVARIPVGKRPRGMALSPGREQLYVALSGTPAARPGVEKAGLPPADKEADGIGVIDLTTRRLVRIIKGVSDPERVALSSDGRRLFVASEDQGLVLMLDVRSGKPLARTPVGAEAEGVDLSPGGIRVYATSEAEGRVSILDARSAALMSQMSVGRRPRSTAFSPDGLRAYVANEASGTISVLDTAALRTVNTLHLPDGMLPMRVSVPRTGSPLYVSTGRGREVLAIDPRSGRVLERAESGARPWDMALSSDDSELYVANGPSNDVSVFALPKLALRTRIHTGEKPWGVVCRDTWWAREGLLPSGVAGVAPRARQEK